MLSLSRGQYVEALDQLYRAAAAGDGAPPPEEGWPLSPYWNDAAYVAERVLTTDETKAYVDRLPPPRPRRRGRRVSAATRPTSSTNGAA
ncbi:hypothetical protein WJ972_28555 [Achromobacter insuavis]